MEISTPLLGLLSQFTTFWPNIFRVLNLWPTIEREKQFSKSLGHRREFEDEYFFNSKKKAVCFWTEEKLLRCCQMIFFHKVVFGNFPGYNT